jgi:hypothetical protein
MALQVKAPIAILLKGGIMTYQYDVDKNNTVVSGTFAGAIIVVIPSKAKINSGIVIP